MAGFYLAWTQLHTLFFETSYFEVRRIEVTGTRRLAHAEVIRQAGVAPGQNVLHFDREAVRQRLESHPGIERAEVQLDGLYTVRLKVTERTPLFCAKIGTRFLEVSSDGRVVSITSLNRDDLPLITGLPWSGIAVGQDLSGHDEFGTAREWVMALDPVLRSQVAEINLSNPIEPYLFLVSGVRVIPKSLSDFKARFTFLCALLDNLQKNAVEPDYLDMRAQNEIVVMPRRFGARP